MSFSDEGSITPKTNGSGDSLRGDSLQEKSSFEKQFELVSTLTPNMREMAQSMLDDWGASVFDLERVSGGHCLLLLTQEVFEFHGLYASCSIDRPEFIKFLLSVEANYGGHHYHNRTHGADVMLGCHFLVSKLGLLKSMSHVQKFALFFGALMHDYNHPGTTNAFEVKTQSDRAIEHSNRSVLEHHHLAKTFFLLKANNFLGLSNHEYTEARDIIIELVLHTDLASHFEFVSKLRVIAASDGKTQHEQIKQSVRSTPSPSYRRPNKPSPRVVKNIKLQSSTPSSPTGATREPEVSETDSSKTRREWLEKNPQWVSPFLEESGEKVKLITKLITVIKLCDLGHTCKHWELHKEWSHRISEEMWLLGDREKEMGVPISPLCDRKADHNIPMSQAGFFKYLVGPFVDVVVDLIGDGPTEPLHVLSRNFQSNQQRWEDELKSTVTKRDAPPSTIETETSDLRPPPPRNTVVDEVSVREESDDSASSTTPA